MDIADAFDDAVTWIERHEFMLGFLAGALLVAGLWAF